MTIQKNDFIEIEFTGKSNGEIFDTTDKAVARQIGLEADVKPLVICVGNGMILIGIDKVLIGKEIGKEHSVHLTPEEGFGKRDSSLVRTIPMKVFKQQNIYPQRGMAFNIDGHLVRVLSSNGGRVMVDFNNPLAGKELDYTFKVIRKVSEDSEKVNALQEYFFKRKFDFEIKDKKVIFKEPKIAPLLQMFREKFNEITGLEFETKISDEKN